MRVAVYCRVSTDKEDQVHSFESQQRYFQDYIARQDGWRLHRIYADEGITGTSTKKRKAFQAMMEDAREGCFSLILTKEISRFARNTLDSIYYTRKLKGWGVGVLFVNDNLNTLREDSELILAIKATMAQEESRSTSSRVKWGQTRRMEQGVVFGRSLLGYDVAGGAMQVNPEGARLVRLIFHKCAVERKGVAVIARELEQEGYRTQTGNRHWQSSVVLKILRNEKYCGDLVQKKTITPDFLTHHKQQNRGEEPLVICREHHTPIVTPAVWQAAQRELARKSPRRRLDGGGHGNKYTLSGKIRCGSCGKPFVVRRRYRKDGSSYRVWRCGTAARGRGAEGECGVGFQLREDVCLHLIAQCLSTVVLDAEALYQRVAHAVEGAFQQKDGADRLARRQRLAELEELEGKRLALLDAYLGGVVTQTEFLAGKARYEGRIGTLKEQLSQCPHCTGEALAVLGQAKGYIHRLCAGALDADGALGLLVHALTVYPDRTLTVQLEHCPQLWRFRAGEKRAHGQVHHG